MLGYGQNFWVAITPTALKFENKSVFWRQEMGEAVYLLWNLEGL